MADDRADPGPSAASVPVPGDALLSPVTLAALAVLLVNDHLLKAAFPGPVTGKLSDVAGVILLPVIAWSAGELLLAAAGRWRGPSRRSATAAAVLTAAVFVAIKTVPAAALAAGWLLGFGQWSLSMPFRALAGTSLPGVIPARIVVDPTDLLVLPCLAVALWLGRSRVRAR